MRTAITLEAEWWQVLQGNVGTGTKEDGPRTGRVWTVETKSQGNEHFYWSNSPNFGVGPCIIWLVCGKVSSFYCVACLVKIKS
jgi:hypothetical protein